MGNLFTCCEGATSKMAFTELKWMLKGKTKRVRQSPEVFVTFDEITMKDEGAIHFDREKFSLKGLRMKCRVEVTGDHEDLAWFVEQELDKKTHLAVERGGVSGHFAEGASCFGSCMSHACTATKMASCCKSVSARAKSWTHRTEHFAVDTVVNMRKEFGCDDIHVDIQEFDCDERIVHSLMRSETCRGFIEHALSAKASEVATRKTKQKVDAIKSKAFGLIESVHLHR
mmetsp:Transcript_56423/g.158270  ORF Transcript_56423/g.158270 Transcript_56423/m.158270 type:complete len:228 (+) Transcript_56423:58-741(+)